MYDLDLQLALAHNQELLRAAARDRLAAEATATQPSAADRAALAAGDLLVGAGLHLEHWARARRMRRALTRLHGIQ
jgi:hypothetical protein